MELWKSILLLFGSIGVANGVFFALILLRTKPKSLENSILAWLILAVCIRIGKSIYVYFSEEPDKLILQIGLSACAFIGPLAFLYFKYALRKGAQLSLVDKALIGSVFIAIVGIGLILPYRSFPEVWNGWLIRAIYLLWILFVLLSAMVLAPLIGRSLKSKKKLNPTENRILAIFLALLFITFTYQFALWIQGFTYLWGSLIFTSVFYYLVYREVSGMIGNRLRNKNRNAELKDGKALLLQIDRTLSETALYKNPSLKLRQLETATGIKTHLISRVLNEVYPNGFAMYINEKRVEEAKRMIVMSPHLTLEGIGYESGFNSKSSFYAAFKKIHGSTPAEYKNSLGSSTNTVK